MYLPKHQARVLPASCRQAAFRRYGTSWYGRTLTAVAPGCSGSANAPKQFSTRNSSCIHPFINSLLDPVWNRNSPDVACLACQIDYRPMIFTALKVVEKELSKFTAAKPAT